MTTLVEDDSLLEEFLFDLHMWLASGHIAAAFKHCWFDGHDVLRRMTFGGG